MQARPIAFHAGLALRVLLAPLPLMSPLALAPALAQAPATEMQPPPAGARYAFACTDANGQAYQEEYKIAQSSDQAIKVDVQTGARQNVYEKPVHAMGTTIVSQERIDGQSRTMSNTGAFSGLRKLAPGNSFRSYVSERRGSGSPIEWSYNVTVVGREVTYHREFGDLAVVVINEDRWANLYSSSMQSHFAPQLRFPIWWKYKDSNGALIECKLDTASGVAPAGVVVAAAPAPAPAQPSPAPAASAARPAPPPPAQAAAAARPAEPPPPAPAPAARPPAAAPPSPYKAPETTAAPTPVAAAPAAAAPSAAAAQAPRPAPPAAPAARPASAPAASKPAPGAPSAAAQERLAQLKDLLAQGVITKEEYAVKEREIMTASPASAIATELSEANRLFRERQLTQDQFVQRRAAALARINPSEMAPKDGLILINQLLEARLISPSEHSAKRSLMLAAL